MFNPRKDAWKKKLDIIYESTVKKLNDKLE